MPEIIFKPRGWSTRHKSYEVNCAYGSGVIFYLSGSRKWEARFSAIHVQGGAVFFDAQAGTPDAVAKRLGQQLDKKSIGLWSIDETVTVRIDRA